MPKFITIRSKFHGTALEVVPLNYRFEQDPMACRNEPWTICRVWLTPSQVKRVRRVLCGARDCRCWSIGVECDPIEVDGDSVDVVVEFAD